MPLHHKTTVSATPLPGIWITESSSGRHFERHWHDCYGFGLLDSGGQKWRSRSGTVEAQPGQIINTVPGEVHDGQPLGAETRRWRIVSVESDAMATLLERPEITSDLSRPVLDDAKLAASLERLFHAASLWQLDTTTTAALAFEEALVASCALLMSRHAAVRTSMPRSDGDVSAVRDRLADDVTNAPSLAELALLAGLSRYQVLRSFKRQFGMPPHRWLLCLRAERARALIRSGVPLATAAAGSGFADQAHMTRTFARVYGFTPGAWRGVMSAVERKRGGRR